MDSARDSVRLVQENLRRCGLTARVLQCDALGILKSGEKFDLIFLDPPYGSGLEAKAIEAVKEFDILTRGGIMVVETRPETALPVLPAEYGTAKAYRYGKIKLTVITREETTDADSHLPWQLDPITLGHLDVIRRVQNV